MVVSRGKPHFNHFWKQMVLNVTNFPQHLTATSEIKHVIETIRFSPIPVAI
jgi:hypothetical protein